MIIENGNYRILIILLVIITSAFLVIYYIIRKPENYSVEVFEGDLPKLDHQFLSFTTQKLLNLTFKYILNNELLCGNHMKEILAVFIVTSYFGNIESRSAMRRAFSTEELEQNNLRRVFLLGEAHKDRYTSENSIINESKRFKDLIQGNFSEAYRNLTYKHVMGLKWASSYCSNAKYIIKMDDDTVVNMNTLEALLSSLNKISKKDFIAGYVLRNMKPVREPANKWYVTQEEYPLRSYPTFVSGWFYVTNSETAQKIVTLSNHEKYFWIDDVLLTGIIANKLKIMHYDISKYFTVHSEYLQCCLRDVQENIDCDIMVGPNGGDVNMFFDFNEKIKKCSLGKCKRREKNINETCVAEKKLNLGKGNAIVSGFKLS